jgi:hypothetical protein
MKRELAFALALLLSPLTASAQTRSPEEQLMRGRAVEAFIWGLPAVNYDLMLQEMLSKTNGKVGQVIYWGRPLDSKNQTLTPNPDALYFMAFYNTKDGPIVLDLPPAEPTARSTLTSSRYGRCHSKTPAGSVSTQDRAPRF